MSKPHHSQYTLHQYRKSGSEDDVHTKDTRDQLGFSFDASAQPAQRGRPERTRPLRLLVVRNRAQVMAHSPDPHTRLWTHAEFYTRISDLAFMHGSRIRDDDAVLACCAAVLQSASAWGVRMAPDFSALYNGLLADRVDVEEVLTQLGAYLSSTKGAHKSLTNDRLREVRETFSRLAQVQRRLNALRKVGAQGALRLGIGQLKQTGLPSALARFSSVTLRHLVDPTPLQLHALGVLADLGLPLRIELPLDEQGRGLAQATRWIADELESHLDAPDLDLDHQPLGNAGAIRPFIDAWYGGSLLPVVEPPVRAELLNDAVGEARRIASVVAAKRAADPRAQIVVALRSLDAAADRIADALNAVGVAVKRGRGPSLRQAGPSRVLLDLLHMRRDGAPRDRVLSLLSQPCYVHALPPALVGQVARTLRQAVARTDVEDINQPEGGYRHRLDRFIEALAVQDRPVQLEHAEFVREQVLTALRASQRIPKRASLSAYWIAMQDLLSEVVQDEPATQVQRVLLEKRIAAQLAVVGKEERSEGAESSSSRDNVDLAAFCRYFERLLNAVETPAQPLFDDAAVEILSLPELFGREVDHVVIADCIHGRLPLAERNDPLLNDADRILINGVLGKRLLRLQDVEVLEPGPLPPRQALEPLWFLGGVSAARQSVFLSAAARDASGKEVAPSEFFRESLVALGASPDATSAGPTVAASVSPRALRLAFAHRCASVISMSSVFTMSSGSSGIDDNGEITAVGENAEAVTLQAQAEVLGLSREDAQSALRLAGMREQRRQYFAADHGNGQDVVEVTSPYAFAVGPKKMKARFGFLLGQRSSRPMTPTRLEALATCRYRGFVEGLLRVDNEIEGGQDGDLRVLGELAHLVLERFYRERRNQKVPPTRMNAADRDRLVEILQSCAAPMHQGQTVGHLAALRANITWLQSALVRTVHQLARHPPVPGASPASFELAVGTPGAAVAPVAGDRDSDAASELRFPAVRLKLQGTPFYFGGVIDRVDKGPDSRVVIDYKNSTASAVARKLAPNELMVHHFQLPLYLRLLEAHVPSDPRRKLFAYLVSLREGETSEVLGHVGRLRRRILDDDAKDGLVAGLGRVLLPVLNGNITAEPGRHCQGCRVARVCRRPDVGWLPEGPVLEQGAQRG